MELDLTVPKVDVDNVDLQAQGFRMVKVVARRGNDIVQLENHYTGHSLKKLQEYFSKKHPDEKDLRVKEMARVQPSI